MPIILLHINHRYYYVLKGIAQFVEQSIAKSVKKSINLWCVCVCVCVYKHSTLKFHYDYNEHLSIMFLRN